MRLTARLIFLWTIAGLVGSPGVPAVNREPPVGVPLPAAKLNTPGVLLAAAAAKLNPPGAVPMERNKKEKICQIIKHCL